MSLSTMNVIKHGNRRSEKLQNISRYFTIGYGDRRDLDTYPLLPIGNSFLCGKVQHEKYLVSTIDIRGQLGTAAFSRKR